MAEELVMRGRTAGRRRPFPAALPCHFLRPGRKRHRVFTVAPRALEIGMCVILHDYFLLLESQQSLVHCVHG